MVEIEQLCGLVISWNGVLYDRQVKSLEPDAEYTLSRLRHDEFGLVLASFERDDTTKDRLEQIHSSNLARYFRRVLIGHGDEEVTLKYAKDLLGCGGARVGVVSDSLTNDLWIAGKLGMQPIWIRHHFPGIKLPQEKVEAGLMVADNLRDLLKILQVPNNPAVTNLNFSGRMVSKVH